MEKHIYRNNSNKAITHCLLASAKGKYNLKYCWAVLVKHRFICIGWVKSENRNLLITRKEFARKVNVNKPDYSDYIIEELLEAKQSIDRKMWPERYQDILDSIAERNKEPSNKESHDNIVFIQYCEEIVEGSFNLFDDIGDFFGLFSKSVRNSKASAFEEYSCPICSGNLDIDRHFGVWNIACHPCGIGYEFYRRNSHSW